MQPIIASLDSLAKAQQILDRSIRDELSRNRQEQSAQAQAMRLEVSSGLNGISDSLSRGIASVESSMRENTHLLRNDTGAALKNLNDSLFTVISGFRGGLEAKLESFTVESGTSFQRLSDNLHTATIRNGDAQRTQLDEIRSTVDARLATLQTENEKKLEQMRQTVDEKLQGTLESRLDSSFKLVSDRLEQVYRGLGEMQALATGVGDLKKVLTNVKTRGTWGEVQLGLLLEQMLAPNQYEKNVPTTGTSERVEYAIRLPGRSADDLPVWLPIDAKFPVEDYNRIMEASERADAPAVEKAAADLEATIRLCARTLSSKYISPPRTTDFGILYLATEGLYAEALRRNGLSQSLQQDCRVMLAGPTTLAALLNSLQMGFRTLAIERHSSEVWETLGEVKTEFAKYCDVLAKVEKKLNEAQTTVKSAEVRSRALERKLRQVATSPLELEGTGPDIEEPDDEEEVVRAPSKAGSKTPVPTFSPGPLR